MMAGMFSCRFQQSSALNDSGGDSWRCSRNDRMVFGIRVMVMVMVMVVVVMVGANCARGQTGLGRSVDAL